jgi:carboxymethylenebutenolidase
MVQKLPQPLIDLYNVYIHGGMSRREFMEGIEKFAVSGLTVAAVAEALMPNYALGQVVPKNDSRLKIEAVTVESAQGNGSIKGVLARPASAAAGAKLPGILVVHENRGLNPHIEDIGRRLAVEGFMTLAPDGLTSVGGYPGDDDKGGQLFSQVNGAKMQEDFLAAAKWLKARPDCTGKIGVTGFCYGGGVSNTLAVRMGADLAAAVPFYGQMPTNPADIAMIKAAILVHHGATDARLAGAWPAYDAALKTANVTHEGYVYDGAGHGFNNDATPQRYNEAASKQAMQRTVAWFKKYLA